MHDDSDCVPRRFVPNRSVPFGPVADDQPRTSLYSDFPPGPRRVPAGKNAFLRDGTISPPRDFTPRPYSASLYSPPSKDRLLDEDSLLRLTPEKPSGAAFSTTERWEEDNNNTKENGGGRREGKGDETEEEEERRLKMAVGNAVVANGARTKPTRNNAERTLSRRMDQLAISTNDKTDETSLGGKTVRLASSSSSSSSSSKALLRADDAASSSLSSDGVKLYVHGIPGGGVGRSNIGAVPSVETKSGGTNGRNSQSATSKRSTRFSNVKRGPLLSAAEEEPSTVNAASAKPPTSRSKKNHAKSTTMTKSSTASASSARPSTTKSSPSVSTTTTTTTTTTSSSLPSARPQLNSVLFSSSRPKLGDDVRERSFDSVVAAEDLLRRDDVVREAVKHEASKKTNVPKDGVIFDNLVPLAVVDDSGDVEIESVRRRRREGSKKGASGGRGGASSSSSSSATSREGRRSRDVGDPADRTEPDIRDFWNPEWEIGRPVWSLPFGADEVVSDDGFDLDRRIAERAADLSDVVGRIERRLDRNERVKNCNNMFYR